MNNVNSLNDKHFTVNGIQYFRNYVSSVHGNKIELYNCYERKDVLIPLTHFSEFLIDGSLYESASEVQSALLDITYSRLTIGDSSSIDQNNVGRVISAGIIGPLPANNPFYSYINAVEAKLNTMQITITAKQAPVIILALMLGSTGGNSYVSKKYKFLFKPGKGNWGLNGTSISTSHLELITAENYLVDDLLSEPNAIIENLGEIPGGNFIAVANSTAWNFTESGLEGEAGIKTYYFSYETDNVLYFVQFVGIPDLYGAEYEAQFTPADFVSSTDSRITDVPTLEDVLAQGGNINVSQLTNNGDGISPYATIAKVNGLSVSVNQAAAELYLKNNLGTTLATVNLGFLNNEGTTFFYNEATEKLELKNDAGTVLSEIPVSAFVSNLIQSVEFNAVSPQSLEFKDAEGNVVDSITVTINNVEGLQAILNSKANTNGSNAVGIWPINITGTAALSGNSSNWLTTNVTDFNTPTGFKLLQAESGALNSPATGLWGEGIQFSSNANPAYINQLVFDITGNLHTRTKNNGNWGTWSAISLDKNVLHKTGDETKSGSLTVDGDNKGYYLGNSGNNASLIYNSNGNLDITPRPGHNTVFTAGKIGIGMNPEYKLDVNGTIRANGGLEISQSAAFGGEVTVPNGTLSTSAINKSQLDTKANDSDVVHRYGNEIINGQKQLNGPILINTSANPSNASLKVNGAIEFDGNNFNLTSFKVNDVLIGSLGQSDYAMTGGNPSAFGISSNGDLQFGAGYLPKAMLKANGNMGIGTTIPLAKVHIADGIGGNQLMLTRGSGGALFGQALNEDGLILYNKAGTETYQRWHQSGNVSIGFSADNNYKLDVSGTGRFSGQLTIPAGTASTSAINKTQLENESISIINNIASNYVPKTGDVTKSGVMTFTESPLIPDGVLNNHPITKRQLNSAKFVDFVIIKGIDYTVDTTYDIGQTGIITVYINAVSNNVTITLPDVLQASTEYTYNFKRIDNSSYNARIASSMTIDGLPFISLGYLHSITVKKVIDKYWIFSKYTP